MKTVNKPSDTERQSVNPRPWFRFHRFTWVVISLEMVLFSLLAIPKTNTKRDMIFDPVKSKIVEFNTYESGWPFVYRRTLEPANAALGPPYSVRENFEDVSTHFRIEDFDFKKCELGIVRQPLFSTAENWNFFATPLSTQFSARGLAVDVLIFLVFIFLVGFLCQLRARSCGLFVFRIKEAFMVLALIAGVLSWIIYQMESGKRDAKLVEEIKAIGFFPDPGYVTVGAQPMMPVEWNSTTPNIILRITNNSSGLADWLEANGMQRVIRLDLLVDMDVALGSDEKAKKDFVDKVGKLSQLRTIAITPSNAKFFRELEFPGIRNLIVEDGISMPLRLMRKQQDCDWMKSFPNLETLQISLTSDGTEYRRCHSILASVTSPIKIESIIVDGVSSLTRKQWKLLKPNFPNLETESIDFR